MKRKFFSIFIIICLICPIMLFVSGCFNNNNSDSSGGQGSGDNSGQTPGIQIPLTPQEKVEVLLSKVYSNFSKNGSVVLGYTAFDIDKEGNKEERTFNNIEKTKIIVDENEETCQFYVHGESSCVYIVKYLSTEDGINQITFDLKTEEYSITDVEDENHLATKKYNWGIYNIDFLKIISNKKNKLQYTYKD